MVAIASSLIFLAVLLSSAVAAPIKARPGPDAVVDAEILSTDPSKANLLDVDINGAAYKRSNQDEHCGGSLVDIDVGAAHEDDEHCDDEAHTSSYYHGSVVDVDDTLRRRTQDGEHDSVVDIEVATDHDDHHDYRSDIFDLRRRRAIPVSVFQEIDEILKRALLDLPDHDLNYAEAAPAPAPAVASPTAATVADEPGVFTPNSEIMHLGRYSSAKFNDGLGKTGSIETNHASQIKSSIEAAPSTPPADAATVVTPVAPASPVATVYTETADYGSLINLDILKRGAHQMTTTN